MAEQIVNCSHCGNRTGQSILYKTGSLGTAYNTSDPSDIHEYEDYYYLTKCKTCGQVSLFSDCEYDENIGNLSEAYLCYPVVKMPSKEIPAIIAETYSEALKVEKISPIAFAILIRRALELLCKDKNASGRNLKMQLDDLAKKNIIPQTLAEMGETLRILGNISAHANDYKLDVVEVNAMKDFFIAMLEYVYVAPSKLLKLKASIAKKKK